MPRFEVFAATVVAFATSTAVQSATFIDCKVAVWQETSAGEKTLGGNLVLHLRLNDQMQTLTRYEKKVGAYEPLCEPCTVTYGATKVIEQSQAGDSPVVLIFLNREKGTFLSDIGTATADGTTELKTVGDCSPAAPPALPKRKF